MNIAYHGKYCGPGWSAGAYQASVESSVEALDEFDETCRTHDAHYARGDNLKAADYEFYHANMGRGFKRSLAAALVGIQGALRPEGSSNMTTKKNLRTAKAENTTKTKVAKTTATKAQAAGGMTMVIPPVAIGSEVRRPKSKITRTGDSIRVTGSDFIATVEANGVTAFGLGKSALMSPAYFQSATLGNLARSYEKYRWNRLRVHYVPSIPTTTAGTIVLTSQRSVTEPGVSPEGGNFLPRAMTQGNAVYSPAWSPCFIDIDPSEQWFLVDPATNVDPDDCIAEELLVYTRLGTAGQPGYLIAEYDIAFKGTIYQPHSTMLPMSTGPGERVNFALAAAVNAVGDDVKFVDTQGVLTLSSVPNGTIIRCVVDLQGSSAPGGTTFSNAFQTSHAMHLTSGTFGSSFSTFTTVGGLVMYCVVINTTLYPYLSIEAAAAGSGSGQLYLQTATTSVGNICCDCAIVRYGSQIQAQAQ